MSNRAFWSFLERTFLERLHPHRGGSLRLFKIFKKFENANFFELGKLFHRGGEIFVIRIFSCEPNYAASVPRNDVDLEHSGKCLGAWNNEVLDTF